VSCANSLPQPFKKECYDTYDFLAQASMLIGLKWHDYMNWRKQAGAGLLLPFSRYFIRTIKRKLRIGGSLIHMAVIPNHSFRVMSVNLVSNWFYV